MILSRSAPLQEKGEKGDSIMEILVTRNWKKEAYTIGRLFVIGCFLGGCSSVKTAVETEQHDSIRTEYVHDTIIIVVRDTLYSESSVEKESHEGTEIEFGEGGTYNSATGQAGNVKSVKTSKKEKEQAQTIVKQASEIEAYKSRNDSLRQVLKTYKLLGQKEQNTADIKPKTSGWHRFLVLWFWATAGLLLAYGCYKGYRLYLKFTSGL